MNKSVSDFVAASMNAVLNSNEHKSLFKLAYQADNNDAKKSKKEKCEDCKEDMDNCYCMKADDFDLSTLDEEEFYAKDSSNYVHDMHDSSDEMHSTAALDVAIDSLLTASAALDSVGMDSGSTLSLKLASMVVEAKKQMTEEEKKELMKRLNKGKKGKKPATSAKSSSSSKSTSMSGSKSTSSSSSSKSTSSKSTAKNTKPAKK